MKYLIFFARLQNRWKVMGRGCIMDEKLGIKCGKAMKIWGKRSKMNENLIQFFHNKWIDEFVTFTRSPRKTWFDFFLVWTSWLRSGVKLHMENILITNFFLGWFHLGKHTWGKRWTFELEVLYLKIYILNYYTILKIMGK